MISKKFGDFDYNKDIYVLALVSDWCNKYGEPKIDKDPKSLYKIIKDKACNLWRNHINSVYNFVVYSDNEEELKKYLDSAKWTGNKDNASIIFDEKLISKLSNFSERLMKCFNKDLSDKYSTKEDADKYFESILDKSKFELKESPLGEKGLFAKDPIKSGQTFIEKLMPHKYFDSSLSNYTWYGSDKKLISGIGYFSNGTCPTFQLYKMGTKLGPYTTLPRNMILNHKDTSKNQVVFRATKDINPGEEIILDYSDAYFYPISKNPKVIKGKGDNLEDKLIIFDYDRVIVNHDPLTTVKVPLPPESVESKDD